jgi:hypothetical protein
MIEPVQIINLINSAILALTPTERWNAARRFDSNIARERWFIITCLISMGVLTTILVVVSIKRKWQENKSSAKRFKEYSEGRGLSEGEREALLDIANKAELKKNESIFTLGNAFNKGVTKTKKELKANKKKFEIVQLGKVLSFLREKLGFRMKNPASISKISRVNQFTSKQIPVKREVHLLNQKALGPNEIKATIIKNTDSELVVRLPKAARIEAEQIWRVRYFLGASVWEFDTSVISCEDKEITLNHSDDVRFINRRSFIRVPVRKPALIARFPFKKSFSEYSRNSQNNIKGDLDLAKTSSVAWGIPKYEPAVVTELAGPALRIETKLKLNTGERVLLVFSPSEDHRHNTTLRNRDMSTAQEVFEDIGEVRHSRAIEYGYSTAVELTGLSDSDVDEMIKATNTALLKNQATKTESEEASTEEKAVNSEAEESVEVQEI